MSLTKIFEIEEYLRQDEWECNFKISVTDALWDLSNAEQIQVNNHAIIMSISTLGKHYGQNILD